MKLWQRFTEIAVTKFLRLGGAEVAGHHRRTGSVVFTQAAPIAKTVSVTLTAAELLGGLITGNQGAGAGATYTLPTGASIEQALAARYLSGLKPNDSFDFIVINLSVVAAETITLATNTGLTLVGDLSIAVIAVGDTSQGTFRVRRTAKDTYSVYRVA